MKKKTHRSKCCNAEVKTNGMPDFLGSKEVCTVSYACLKCGKPCNVTKPNGQKRRILTAKKRITAAEKRLDFQGEVIQKLVEFFDGITIHPIKGVVLTPKKKRQLAEFQKIEQKLSKSKAKKSR